MTRIRGLQTRDPMDMASTVYCSPVFIGLRTSWVGKLETHLNCLPRQGPAPTQSRPDSKKYCKSSKSLPSSSSPFYLSSAIQRESNFTFSVQDTHTHTHTQLFSFQGYFSWGLGIWDQPRVQWQLCDIFLGLRFWKMWCDVLLQYYSILKEKIRIFIYVDFIQIKV